MGAPHRHGLAPPETLFLDHYSAQKVATWGGPRNRRSCRAAVFVQLQRALIACNGLNNVEICIEHGLNATKGVRRLTIWVMDDIEYPRLGTERARTLKLLNRPIVDRLLVTNPAIAHPKLSPYPIGIYDYRLWPKHLDGREARTHQRSTLLLCAGMSSHFGRSEKLVALTRNGFQCQNTSKDSPDVYIEKLLGARFVFSPKGHGQQSHRDWEVLLAGAVPLIDEPPDTLAALYAGLPVVAVRDWSLVTPHFLEEQWAEIRRRVPGCLRHANYFFPYWSDVLQGTQPLPTNKQRLQATATFSGINRTAARRRIIHHQLNVTIRPVAHAAA